MARLFISHSSKNNAQAAQLVEWLERQGWGRDQVFLDLDDLKVGTRWRAVLDAMGPDCEAVIVCLSDDWIRSPECTREFTQAQERGKPIFPVFVASVEGPIPRFVTDLQIGDLNAANGLDALRKSLLAARVDPEHFRWPPPNDPKRAPYRGLETYEQEDAAVFFGRDVHIRKTLDLLRSIQQRRDANVVVVLGASGSGKSSFLRAGLLARLGRLSNEFEVAPVVRPGADLARFASAKDWPSVREGSSMVLAVDQAEEMLQAPPELVESFWRRIRDRLDASSDLIVLMTVRSDSYQGLQRSQEFQRLAKHIVELPQIESYLWPELIAGPARIAGEEKRFDDELIATILEDHSRTSALPLLSYSLRQLYENAAPKSTIGVSDYNGLGGLQGIVERRARNVLDRWTTGRKNPADAVTRLFIPALVTTDAVGEPRRRTANRNEIPASSLGLADLLVDERLLVADGEGDDARLEVAHESLFRAWPLLNQIVERDLGLLNVSRKLQSDVFEWQLNGFRTEYLVYKGDRLRSIISLLDQNPGLMREHQEMCAHYLWLCSRADVPGARRSKYLLLLLWAIFVIFALRLGV